MKNLELLRKTLHHEEMLHRNDIYNYAIPESWNVYGFRAVRHLRDKQLLLNPYSFYAFTLDQMFHQKEICPLDHSDDPAWLRYASVYSFMVRTATSWDHDRDNVISHDNIYHMADNGTFLKSIVLLPLLKRMGINTVLMHQPFALGKSQKPHDYACKEAVIDFQVIDENLADPMISTLDAKTQCAAFIEACHYVGIRVILEYCPAKMARENAYILQHPDWFYWMDAAYETNYHAPVCHVLPQNTLPYDYTLKDLYKSDDVLAHIAMFKQSPTSLTTSSLEDIKKQLGITIAPSIVDQINANVIPDTDTTILKFYEENSVYAPKDSAPTMLQDRIRPDLHGGTRIVSTCWKQLNRNITWFIKQLKIDGLYIEKPFLLPEKLQQDFVKTAKKLSDTFVMIAEDSSMENSRDWIDKGYDMMSGNSGYEETKIWDYKFHNFAYRLKGNVCPLFAASEFYDSRRVSSLEHGKKMAIMLTVMNHFLPNGIPMMLNGIESYDVQPLQLSEYGDQKYTYSLSREDERYHRQPYIDQYYFNYLTHDLSILPNLLEKITHIRSEYLDAICKAQHCIPIWFDSPNDPGIGFTFIEENKALMVVCNVHVHTGNALHVHTDNLFPELPFTFDCIQQIFSTCDPYVHNITLDALGNLSLSFDAGEVKFIEFH